MGNKNTMRLNTCSRPRSRDVLVSSLERRFSLSKACTCTAVIHCLLEHLGRAGPRDVQTEDTGEGSSLPEKGPHHWCQLPSQRTEPHHLATAQTPCSCSSRRESATGLFSEGHRVSRPCGDMSNGSTQPHWAWGNGWVPRPSPVLTLSWPPPAATPHSNSSSPTAPSCFTFWNSLFS